ncbi:MAG: ABC transporter permease [Bacteroidota bacterium]
MIKRYAHRFFRWFCHPDYFEDIEGDLEELYRAFEAQHTPRKAEWNYLKEVLLLFRPTIIRPISFDKFQNLVDMFSSYLKIGFRMIAKHRLYSFIHILGLALGLAAFLLINQYTKFEKSYDRFHEQADNIYRLTTDQVINGQMGVRDAMTFAPAGAVLQAELPEVIGTTTTFKRRRMVFQKNGQPVEEKGVIAVDSNFLNIFSYELIAGDKSSLFGEPYTMVLTEKQARKYFGDQSPIGQTIHVLGNFNRPFKVTGVLANTPANTHYRFDVLISLKSYTQRVQRDAWNGYNYYSYLKLSSSADVEKIKPLLPSLTKKYLGEDNKLVFNLQPVPSVHLHSNLTFEPQPHGSAEAVIFLDIISIFILIIAWINYINLSTARATERAKEVGLRKVVGAKKGQLIGQFFIESLFINLLGAIVAVGIAQLALPYFNSIVGQKVLTTIWKNSDVLQQLAIFCGLGTIITGIYPAFVIAGFRPIRVLKGNFQKTRHGLLLRKGLVVFQFTASLGLIAATLIVYQQIKYMTNRDLGIDTEQVIGFNNAFVPNLSSEAYESQYRAFCETLRNQTGISQVASISSLPGGGSSEIGSSSGGFQIVGKTDLVEFVVYQNRMDDKLVDALDIKLVAGRDFDRELAEENRSIIVNESLLKQIGIANPEDVLNQYFQFGTNPENTKYKIVGVIQDYNRSTLKSSIEPTMFYHRNVNTNTLVRLNGEDMQESIQRIQATWQQFYPNSPFSYAFLDDRFARLYQEDRKFGFIFGNFAGLAIFVAILGLFGLAAFLSLQRTKEVGVRKVLGASTTNIIFLFFKDFVSLLLVAILISVPLVYWSMSNWLNGYAYRIDFPWWVLGVSLSIVTILSFLTVSWQTQKVATLNPVETIRG